MSPGISPFSHPAPASPEEKIELAKRLYVADRLTVQELEAAVESALTGSPPIGNLNYYQVFSNPYRYARPAAPPLNRGGHW